MKGKIFRLFDNHSLDQARVLATTLLLAIPSSILKDLPEPLRNRYEEYLLYPLSSMTRGEIDRLRDQLVSSLSDCHCNSACSM